jgi:hypothetical protein
VPHPSHSSWCDHRNNIWWGGQTVNLCIMQSVHFHVIVSLLGPNTLAFCLWIPYVPPLMWETTFYTHIQEQARCVVLCIFNLYILGYQTERQKILHQMITIIFLGLVFS